LIRFVLAILGLALVFSAPALADPVPPPNADCHHGNSDQPCRPDPQPSHGNDCTNLSGGNQDHCIAITPSPSPSRSPSPSPSASPSASPTPRTSPSPTPPPFGINTPAPSPTAAPLLTKTSGKDPTTAPNLSLPNTSTSPDAPNTWLLIAGIWFALVAFASVVTLVIDRVAEWRTRW
jgi:hypothetical protein